MGDEQPAAKRARKFDEGHEVVFNINAMRRVTLREFRGKTLIDIREYYSDAAGDLRPGKKGISLTEEQWAKLVELMPKINEALGLDPSAQADEEPKKMPSYE